MKIKTERHAKRFREKQYNFKQFLSEIRCETIQVDSMRFRRNLERLGEIFAYEISKTFTYKDVEVQTPLGISPMSVTAEEPVLGEF